MSFRILELGVVSFGILELDLVSFRILDLGVVSFGILELGELSFEIVWNIFLDLILDFRTVWMSPTVSEISTHVEIFQKSNLTSYLKK